MSHGQVAGIGFLVSTAALLLGGICSEFSLRTLSICFWLLSAGSGIIGLLSFLQWEER